MADYTRVNLRDVDDMAAKHGFGEQQEARFPREALGLDASGVGHLRVKPGQRQPFAHRHNEAEEVHVVLSGSGRMKLDDEIVKVGADDVIRVGPGVTRAFEAGPDGLEYLVFSPRHEGDAEIVQDFWTEED
jgi:mannose-6-phosphate isomerase-like protein (cupin superfamily)